MAKGTEAKIWYLFHSGFAVKTANKFLVFDYYAADDVKFCGPLAAGQIDPQELHQEDVTVFSSHRHPDHFDRKILEWSDVIPNIRYVLSDDIRLSAADRQQYSNKIEWVHFNRRYVFEGLTVETLHSTDEGVAFVVEVDGIVLYHAGDLNWWHWKEESKHYNDSMAGQYRHEIDKLQEKRVDLAFIPMDPRLEENYFWGMYYFLKKVRVEMVFPMHFGADYTVFERLEEDEKTAIYRDKIMRLSHRGELFLYQRENPL